MRRLEPDEVQSSYRESVRDFCAGRPAADLSPDADPDTVLREVRSRWLELAKLGVFEIGVEDGGGSLIDVVYVLEELGQAGVAGPWADTYAALLVATDVDRDDLVAGRRWASVEVADRFMWADADALLYRLAPEPVSRLDVKEVLTQRSTIGATFSARIITSVLDTYPDAPDVVAVFDVCTSAYLTGLCRSMMQIASDHARTRRQFGRTLGEFQAVSYALADADALVMSAQSLTRQAAAGDGYGALASAARRAASDAAVQTATVCHQVCGGLGFTLEFSLWSRSSLAIQVANQGRLSAVDTRLLNGLRGSVSVVGTGE